MIHLKCENHPQLRWAAKEEAINEKGRYTGARQLFFFGIQEQNGHIEQFFIYGPDGKPLERVEECTCPTSKLVAIDMVER